MFMRRPIRRQQVGAPRHPVRAVSAQEFFAAQAEQFSGGAGEEYDDEFDDDEFDEEDGYEGSDEEEMPELGEAGRAKLSPSVTVGMMRAAKLMKLTWLKFSRIRLASYLSSEVSEPFWAQLRNAPMLLSGLALVGTLLEENETEESQERPAS